MLIYGLFIQHADIKTKDDSPFLERLNFNRSSLTVVIMQGRGRGSFLGLLLLEQKNVGKMVGSFQNGENIRNEVTPLAVSPSVSPPLQAHGSESTTTDFSAKKYSPPIWTSFDLLGNKGKRGRLGSNEKTLQTHEKSQENENTDTRDVKDVEANDSNVVSPVAVNKCSSPSLTESVLQHQSKTSEYAEAVKTVHLFSPQEFLPHSSSIKEPEFEIDYSLPDSSSETHGSSSTVSSTYIPPHRRKGYVDAKPEIYSELAAMARPKRIETRKTNKDESSEIVNPHIVIESEMNWQKWKLQRNFKKMLNNLSVDSVMGLGKDIKDMIIASQLSTKFPGVSEVNVILELLVSRVLDQKETVEVAVHVCRLLNAMYPTELPSNLREVVKDYRKDAFSGVANKNSRCDKFCLFIGKLCDIAKMETKSFQDCLKQSVVGCLHEWISPFQNVGEYSHEAELKVVYLCDLLEFTKNGMATGKRSWIKSCFGKIKNCILNDKLSRNVRENLLDAVIKHSLQSPGVKETEDEKTTDNNETNSCFLAMAGDNVTDLELSGDSYKDVKKMLSELGFENLLETFQDNLIRDTLLSAEKNELKKTLQEAGFAPGAILEIQLYLEKNGRSTHTGAVEKVINDETEDCKSSSLDLNTRINDLENDLKLSLGTLEAERQDINDTKGEKIFREPAETQKVIHIDLKEAKNELLDIQADLNQATSVSRPPPGFSIPGTQNRKTLSPTGEFPNLGTQNRKTLSPTGEFSNLGTQNRRTLSPTGFSIPGTQNRRTRSPTPKDEGLFSEARLHMEISSGQNSRREVFLGERKTDISEYRCEGGFENEAVNWSKPDGNYTRNPSGFSKYKGRGRGRRDTSGSLETSMNKYPNGSEVRWNVDKSEGNYRQSSAEFGVPSDGIGAPSGGAGSSSAHRDTGLGSSRPPFGTSMPIGCFICGAKDHRSAYCKNNKAMFD